MASVDLLLTIAQQLGRIVQPLAQGLVDEGAFANLLLSFGWSVPPSSFAIADVQAAIPIADDLTQAAAALGVIEASTEFPPIDDYTQLVTALRDVITLIAGVGGSTAPAGIPSDAWTTFVAEMPDWLFVKDLEERKPGIVAVLIAGGIVTEETVPADPTSGRLAHVKRAVAWDNLGTLLTDPRSLVSSTYGWNSGTQAFDGNQLVGRLGAALQLLGVGAGVGPPDQSLLDEYYGATSPFRSQASQLNMFVFSGADGGGALTVSVFLLPIPERNDPNGPPKGIVLGPAISVTGTQPQGLFWPFSLSLAGTGGRAKFDAARFELLPSGFQVKLTSPTETTVDASVALSNDLQSPLILIGSVFSHRLEVSSFGIQLSVTGTVGDPEITLGINLDKLRVVLDTSDADSFVGAVVPGGETAVEFSGGIDWSSKTGFHFRGSAKGEVTIPIGLTVAGVVRVQSLTLQGILANEDFSIGAGISASVALGPVDASIQGIGVELELSPTSGGGGLFGKLDYSLGFLPPIGVGLSIDAGSVHGGGFISFDPTAGRYFGGLQLTIYDISVTAFALIETKVPDVDFSFVIVISAQFTPIQLGFGFTLNGVGGMIGINRGIDTNALASLVRAGQSGELLFPKNVISDAPTIVKDLTTVFPATQGQYVFGPLGKLGWGTPTLITGEIGIVLEYPAMVVVLLGEVKCLLPKPDQALVKLNLSIDGVLDFPNKTFSMDADLHDSVINGFPVSGQMAMRVSWGDQPNFVFSIGGFHPAYTPPPNFPKLQPMTLDLGSHGPAKISVSGFFAVTSNTVQVGGSATLHAGGSGITLDASVSVKALFVFQPFSFEADIDASVKISFHGYGPSVHLSGQLDGPSPWHIKGEVCVSIIWWDACLGFDVTFGGNTQITQPSIDPWLGAPSTDPTADIIGLQRALSDPGNWSGALVPGTVSSVARAQGTDTLVDPVGGLTVRQKTAPVETPNPLTKFGVAKTTTPIKFSKVQATLGTGQAAVPLTAVQAVNEAFAPAQFFDMNDGKKLSSAGFEQYQAGYLFATADGKNARGGSTVTFQPEVQTFLINSDGSDTLLTNMHYVPTDPSVAAANKRSAVAKGGLTLAGTRRFVNRAFTQSFSEQLPTFVIGDSTTLAVPTNARVPAPAAAVRSATLIALDVFRGQNVELALGVQVTALHDMPPTG
jgi:hypothetical protein